MVRVLIFGATGFIGGGIAKALRRNGHRVYAVVRTEAKALELTKQEITPILADISDTEAWVPILDSVDIVIDSSPSYGGISEGIVKALKGSNRVTKAKPYHPKLGFIYISGVWVHGDSYDVTSDIVPVGEGAANPPAPIVGWRPAFEDSLLTSRDVLDVVILRPGFMFGGDGSLGGIWWRPIVEALISGKKSVTIPGKADAVIPLLHKDDFGEAVLNTVEKFEILSHLGYPVFSLAGAHEKLEEITKAAVKVLEYDGELTHQLPENDYLAAAASTTILLDSSRAANYLGWQPKHTSLIRYADIYIKAFLYTTEYYSTVTAKAEAK